MVRATFRMRVYARALRPNLSIAISSRPLARLVDLAVLLDMAVRHLGVAVDLHPLEPLELDLPGRIDPGLDLPGGFSRLAARQVPVLHRRDLDVDVDPVHQGAGDLRAVALDLGDACRCTRG